MDEIIIQNPFKHGFLADFIFTPQILPFTDKEIMDLDKDLARFEQVFLSPDVEKHLISKNEFLASFAISKAEQSSLTLKEAQDVYNLLLNDPEYDFISQKLKDGKKLTQKDHDHVEFFNIAKTFRNIGQRGFSLADLTPNFIKNIHLQITQGLDIFQKYILGFTVYKSGQWRDNDSIRVGSYAPAPFGEAPSAVKEIIDWYKNNHSVVGVAVLHTALYALHPFNNGNKRVCRILEHLLLRELGLNVKNLYSTSYYYHKEKPRYYKYLLYSLERKNLNHFTSFALEAAVLSIVGVIKTSLEAKRGEFLNKQSLDDTTRVILKPLIKRGELQFKNLYGRARKKIARQTFVTYLNKAVEAGVIKKREAGRATYYGLNISAPERDTLRKWVGFAKSRISYIDNDFLLSV